MSVRTIIATTTQMMIFTQRLRGFAMESAGGDRSVALEHPDLHLLSR